MKKSTLPFNYAYRTWSCKLGLTFFELIIFYIFLAVIYYATTAYSPKPWHFVDDYVAETCSTMASKKDHATLKTIAECKESELDYAERYKTLMSVLPDTKREDAIAYIKAHEGMPYSEMYDFLTRKNQ